MHAGRYEHVFQQQIYLNGGFSLNRCTQRSTSQALLEVFLDLSQPELQVNPLCLFSPTGVVQLVHTLVQGGLPAFCPTETREHTQHSKTSKDYNLHCVFSVSNLSMTLKRVHLL